MNRIFNKFLFEAGWALYFGKVVSEGFVSHQGTAVFYSTDGNFDIDFRHRFLDNAQLAVVPSLVKHNFIGKNFNHTVLLIDPDNKLSILLNQQFKNNPDIAVSTLKKSFDESFATFHTGFSEQAMSIFCQLKMFCGQTETELIDARICKSVDYIKRNIENKIKIQELSKVAGLSESRLAHLFRQQIGMPIRKYVLWQRMKYSFFAAQNGFNLTEAALSGGFADAAHFSRTVSALFGARQPKFCTTANLKISRFIQAKTIQYM
ncbi:MAG: helix-turn-helix transcriptional regulator [Leptolyngbyaceae cyanobacterium SM1_4_3]|nr:helix-turn-helix transcriptional regulator [Leptolyngbyaceae cyanobacterium SM1_4_3]